MDKMTKLWETVAEATKDAYSIAFDGCHKIYVAMDKHESMWFHENYEHNFVGEPDAMLAQLKEWWEQSCGLKFISAVRYSESDPNAGFTSLIGQDDWQEDDEDEDDELLEWA